MPFIDLKTTASIGENEKKKLTELLGKAIELIPGKSEDWLMLNFSGDQMMAFKGSFEGCAMLEVKIFGKAQKASFDALTKELCKIMNEEFGIRKDRVYVKYEELDKWGWNDMNF